MSMAHWRNDTDGGGGGTEVIGGKTRHSDVLYQHSQSGKNMSKENPARSWHTTISTHSAVKQVVMASNPSYNIFLLVHLTTEHTDSFYYLLNCPAFKLHTCDAILTFRSSAISLGFWLCRITCNFR
jgi:hypothetical protein